jgi:hypothetical protein
MAMLAEWWAPTRAVSKPRSGLFRHSASDAWLVGAAVVQAALFAFAFTSLPNAAAALIFGAGTCWCSNTVSHNHLHNPLFQSRTLNRGFSLFLSMLLGIPQSIWKARHLWHHAGEPAEKRALRPAWSEVVLVLAGWLAFLALAPRVFLLAYVPGYVLGMALSRLQGDMEHALDTGRERGVSHYGWLYNRLWFNDGYHAEHHRFPTEHWTRLPLRSHAIQAPVSAFSPHFRWLERSSLQGSLLGALERLPLWFGFVERFMLRCHERALGLLLARLPAVPRHVAIIGGGLFPRSLLVLSRLLPGARFSVIDLSADNVACAERVLRSRNFDDSRIRFLVEPFDAERHRGFDLVVAPLAFVGNEATLSLAAVETAVITHDWAWRRRGIASEVVSWLLFKRVCLALPRAR